MLPKKHIDVESIRYTCRVHSLHVAAGRPSLPDRPPTASMDASKYHYLSIVFRGVFSKVVLAQSLRNKDAPTKKNLVAIKIMRKDVLIEQNHVAAAKREMNFLMRLRHRSMIEFLGYDMDTRRVYLFMEYAAGGDVMSLLEKQVVPEIGVQFWCSELLDVLEYLHDVGVCHRDVKPANLMITSSGHIKIIDFGFARHLGDSKTYTVCGSPEYVSPEILLNKGHGLSTDMWSFGVCIYEMFTGFLPFGDDDGDTHPLELARDIAAANYACDAESVPSADLRDVLQQLLQVDPHGRPDPAVLKNSLWFDEYFESIVVVDKGPDHGWKPTRRFDTKMTVPKVLLPNFQSDNDTSNFQSYPKSIEEHAVEILGESEVQFQTFDVVARTPE